MLRDLGIFMGDHLNEASDNLMFTFLIRRPDVLSLSEGDFLTRWKAFEHYMTGHGHPLPGLNSPAAIESTLNPASKEPGWDKHVQQYLKGRRLPKGTKGDRWGWKEPNTHVMLHRITPLEPRLKYIHVLRHGLDMAFSTNHKQIRRWGPDLLGPDHDYETCPPPLKFRYWVEANQRLLPVAESMGQNFLWLKFEDVCREPQKSVEKLLDFIDIDFDETTVLKLAQMVRPPDSIDRWREHDLSQFPAEDLSCLGQFGYPVP
jgi:hypothetical protein